MNNAGQVVGFTELQDMGMGGFTYGNGQIEYWDNYNVMPTEINNAGQAVGYDAGTFPSEGAFIRSEGGVMTNLNTLIPVASGWFLASAWGINDQGEIVGAGMHNGQPRGFLLTEVITPPFSHHIYEEELVKIVHGVRGGGGGFVYSPSGSGWRIDPVDPWDLFRRIRRNITSAPAREMLVSAMLVGLASLVDKVDLQGQLEGIAQKLTSPTSQETQK